MATAEIYTYRHTLSLHYALPICITNIADARTVRWGSDVKHIDLGDKTLLPGLIDMHVHLDGPADIGGYRGLEFTDSFWGMTAVKNANDMLGAGFTTVRNRTEERRGGKEGVRTGRSRGWPDH